MPCVLLLDESYLTEGSSTNDLQAFEVFLSESRATKAEKLSLLLSMLLTMGVTLKIETERIYK